MSPDLRVRRPPRAAEWLLTRSLPESDREAVLGDASEEFLHRAERDGPPAARRWYWRQLRRSFFINLLRLVPSKRRSGEGGRTPLLGGVMQDLRYALRTLGRAPAFSGIVVVTLALGIGANTAIFSVVHSVLLRPLPFPDADRLVMLWERQPSGRQNVVSMVNFRAWEDRSRSFEAMAAFRRTAMNLLGGDEPVQVTGAVVTGDFFKALRVPPLLGRTFLPGEDEPGAAPVIVLSHGFWQRRFGGRSDVIGRRISVNATHHEVIGVMPRDFSFPDGRVQAFVTLRARAEDGRNYSVVARLRGSAGLSAAREELRAIAAQTAEERPRMNANWSAAAVPLHEQTVGQMRRPLLVILTAVSFVLLIACANIASLVLMRASSRAREFAIRRALGAGTWRLLRQVLLECLALAGAGAMLGIAVAWLSIRTFTRLAPATLAFPRLNEISIDASVLLFALVAAVATALLFGIGPALASSRMDGDRRLQAGRSVVSGQRRLQSLMVIAEVALAVPLLAGAGLMVHSLVRLAQVEPGFRAEGVLTVRMVLLPVRDRAFHAEMVAEALARVRALPGVVAAGSIGRLPMEGGNSGSWYYRADRPEPPLGQRPGGDISIVTPGYFAAMDIPVVKGRDFDDRDRIGSPHVAILNQTAAREWFGDEPALGARLKVSWNDAREVEIVGVAADIRHSQLQTVPDPCLFLPNAQQPFPFSSLVIRTAGDPRHMIEPVKREIRSVDPDQGVGEIQTMEQLVSDAMARPKAQTMLLGVFGVLALALTCVGIYGVVAYAVTQRTREIGLRLALGATPASTCAFVLRDGLRLTAAGLVIGLAAAAVLSRFMQGLLYEVKPLDPTVFAAVAILLTLVAAAACSIPAVRAARVDPAIVLRDE
jgi:putative ABC transport system permease protein